MRTTRTTECNSNCWWNSLCNTASTWRSQDGSQQHSRKERLPCDLETGSPGPKNWQWDLLKAPPDPSLLQCLHKGTGGSEQEWFKPGAYACGRRDFLQNSHWHPHSSHHYPGTIGNNVTLAPRDNVRNQSKQGANPVVQPQQQSKKQAMPAVSFNGEVIERTNSLRYLQIYFHRMLTYKTQVEATKLRCKKGLSTLAFESVEQCHLSLV